MRRALLALALTAGALAGPAAAQNLGGPFDAGSVQSQVLVVEFERVFSESAFGRRVVAEFEAEGAEIAAENRRIEAELTEEERSLTERRATMPPAEFRALATQFDEKVQALRQQQDAKARALNQRSDEARRQFLAVAEPVMRQLMQDSGAAVMLERRTVFLAADAIDVTEDAIALIDAEIGDGEDLAPIADDRP